MEDHQLLVKHKQSFGQWFILVLPHAAALLETIVLSQHRVCSSRIISHVLHVMPNVSRDPRRGLRFVQWGRTRNPVKERDPIVHGRMEPSNTSMKAIDLNPNCLK